MRVVPAIGTQMINDVGPKEMGFGQKATQGGVIYVPFNPEVATWDFGTSNTQLQEVAPHMRGSQSLLYIS